MEKPQGVNLKEKSGVSVPKAAQHCLQLRSGNSCNNGDVNLLQLCCSFGSIDDVESGGPATWATVCPQYLTLIISDHTSH